MKFSFEWLKDLSGYHGSADNLAELLSAHSVETEVEGPQVFANIIVAKVTKIEKHPNADRLRVVELTDGKNTIAPVVCGAWNFDVGAIVPLALPGSTIPHNQHDLEGKPFVLGKAVIRGVESQGMICSGKELGLGDDGGGIFILDSDLTLGSELSLAQDGPVVLDISVPANRPDLMSCRGIATEIVAILGSKLNFDNDKHVDFEKSKNKFFKLTLSDPKLCNKYSTLKFTGVVIGTSPEFIRKRLSDSGVRPINNIVDITNYVMLETGQPLHAFDAQTISSAITVRRAYVNETIVTLDGVERKLGSDTLVIADGRKPIAIAGIMGGKSSAVTDSTTELILEGANFNPVSIRKTARDLNLRTDASSRFEKNLPLALVPDALAYAYSLLVKYANAKLSDYASVGAKNLRPRKMELDPKDVQDFLGLSISVADQKRTLSRLGFKSSGTNKLKVTIPLNRNDIAIWQDLAEEIMRIHGLEKIVSSPHPIFSSSHMTDPLYHAREKVIDLLTGLGLTQIYTYSFVSVDDVRKWEIPETMLVEIINPLSLDQQYMRPNLVMNGLKILERNAKSTPSGGYFELGNIYWKEGRTVCEKMYLSILASGRESLPSARIVGVVEEMLNRLNIEYVLEQETEQMAAIKVSGRSIGKIATFPVSDLKWVGVHLEFEKLAPLIREPVFKKFSKYPAVVRDLAILTRKDLPWAQIEKLVREQSELIESATLFDIYVGKNIPSNRKSLAFRITYQSSDRTLTENEINKVQNKIVDLLRNKFSAEIRD